MNVLEELLKSFAGFCGGGFFIFLPFLGLSTKFLFWKNLLTQTTQSSSGSIWSYVFMSIFAAAAFLVVTVLCAKSSPPSDCPLQ